MRVVDRKISVKHRTSNFEGYSQKQKWQPAVFHNLKHTVTETWSHSRPFFFIPSEAEGLLP